MNCWFPCWIVVSHQADLFLKERESPTKMGSFFQAKEMGANLSEFGSNCQHLLEHVQSLVVQSITPKLTTGKCNSCYIQGFQKFYQGIKVRPAIPCQKEVVELLQSILSKGPSKFLDVVPEIFSTLDNQIFPDTWNERYRKADLGMRRVRKRRKAEV